MKKVAVGIIWILVGAIASPAFGEEKQPERSWKDEAELSYVNTSGNSETSTFAGKNTLKIRFTDQVEGEWIVAALRSEDDGEKTAERYSTSLKVDYLFTEQFYAGLGAGWLRDEFAGFNNRYYAGPFTGYKFFTGPSHFLKGELGLNYTKEEYIDKSDEGFLEGRAYGLYEYAFTKATKFSQSAEYLQDFNDGHNYKAISISAVTAAITEVFSIKTSYEIRYVNRPVPDTLEKTDRILTVALVANL